ncbi:MULTISPECIES: SMI1/KNR4 family protein [Cytobacillus]|uniref:SMI1/KNR4 family protein n=2 Tax=Cytobacillus TaxID=2675230 RepID=A0AA46P6M0_CYTFI|nr:MULTISPECIES: SMI1/KNR4 family protein [Cytobacillus]AND43033.1 cell wall assembly protein [Cytobacillus oceanisediminis 2691]MCM3244589.1 SMI1/KNR4 family protein [Cytobacillus oceanisediminis]USK47549.1 SMI1/KNR4 family protein [Cytobacillus oceanisediminis]UYG98321.1 SMI1/KNR4 family protein [Cytobacillus firmus]
MWKEFITSISMEHQFKNPATKFEIAQIKKGLNVELPDELAALFNETNGVFDNWNCPLVWSTSQIIKDNLFYRNFEGYRDIYMPFDDLFFFSDAGNGDLFCYAILKSGTIEKNDIYVWNHEDDSRTWVAASLKHFIEGWITGKIDI